VNGRADRPFVHVGRTCTCSHNRCGKRGPSPLLGRAIPGGASSSNKPARSDAAHWLVTRAHVALSLPASS
jgi:hypothetical protein